MNTVAVGLVAIAGVGSTAGATDRYWIEPTIGFWDSPSDWSLADGGAPGGGLPQPGDRVYFTGRSICIFDGPSPTGVFRVGLRGSGSGVTQVRHTAGALQTNSLYVGDHTPRNEYLLSGGMLDTGTNAVVGFGSGGAGRLEISGTGSLTGSLLQAGAVEGDGHVDVLGGSLDIDTIWLSVQSSGGTLHGGTASLSQTGGVITTDEFLIGRNGEADVQLSAGQFIINDTCTVGIESVDPSTIEVSGTADVDIIQGTLTIGNDAFGPGNGVMLITGGTVTADQLRVGEGPDTQGLIRVDGGTLCADTANVGLGGDEARLILDSGILDVGTMNLGAAPNTGGYADTLAMNGGTYQGNTLNVGADTDAVALLDFQAGSIDAVEVDVPGAEGADGRVSMWGGTITAGSLRVGADGAGEFEQLGTACSVDVFALTVGGSPSHDAVYTMGGGTLIADTIDVLADSGAIGDDLAIHDGLVVSNTLSIGANTEVSIGGVIGTPDARISTITNQGLCRFSASSAILSGPVFLSTRLLGTFINHGELIFQLLGGNGDGFVMNLENHSTFNAFSNVDTIIVGAITNHPDGRIYVRRASDLHIGFLEARSALGLVNNGELEIDRGVVRTPYGVVTNNATVIGFGEIAAPFINNGSVVPSPTAIEEDLVCGDGFTCGPDSSTRFVITNQGNNRVVVRSGDAALGGTINVAFAADVPLPPLGTEFELIVCQDGDIDDVFAFEAVLGFPCEIVYEPTRVLARSIRCGVSDIAVPYGQLDLADVTTFASAFLGGDLIADLDSNGLLDLADVNLFVTRFVGGCS